MTASGDSRWRQGGLTRLVAVVALLTASLLGAAPALADSGLEVTARSRYVVDLDAERVTATMTMTLRNTAADEETEDGLRYFFFDAYAVPLPAAATAVRATSDGQQLPVQARPIEGEAGYRAFSIGFPELRYGQSRTIELAFTLTGQPPRSDDPTRIGPTYATFPVFGPGGAGGNTVEVVVAKDTEVDSTIGSFERTEDGDADIYTSTEDNLDPGLSATMAVHQRGTREGVPITVAGIPLTLLPYPNDPEWAGFIETWADKALPVLVDLIGQEWPGDIDTIREDSGSLVRGFEGWYSTSDREIVLSEVLDSGLLFHELSHAWLNSATIADRWLYEGLAEYVAEQTAERTGGSFTAPELVDRSDDRAVPLATWSPSPDFRGTGTDRWAYPASHQVVSALLDGLPDESLRAVIAESARARSPWDLEGRHNLSGGRLTTRAFLDILAHHDAPAAVDGSATELYQTWVLGEQHLARLEGRDEAHQAYATFAAEGPWGPPLGLRRALARWNYDVALELIADHADLPASSAHLVELAERTGVELDPQLQADYENADDIGDYQGVAAGLATVTTALREYQDAQAVADAERHIVAEVGARILRLQETAAVARANFGGGDYAASVAASQLTQERSAQATMIGAGAIALAALLVLLVIALAVLIRRGTRRRRHAW